MAAEDSAPSKWEVRLRRRAKRFGFSLEPGMRRGGKSRYVLRDASRSIVRRFANTAQGSCLFEIHEYFDAERRRRKQESYYRRRLVERRKRACRMQKQIDALMKIEIPSP